MNSPLGHYCSNDKQQRDKQTTCDTSSGFPREPVWFTDWQRRLKDQRDQRSKFISVEFWEVVLLHPNMGRKRPLQDDDTSSFKHSTETCCFKKMRVCFLVTAHENPTDYAYKDQRRLSIRTEWKIFVCTSSNIGAHIAIWLAAAPCMSKCVWGNLRVLETAFQFG